MKRLILAVVGLGILAGLGFYVVHPTAEPEAVAAPPSETASTSEAEERQAAESIATPSEQPAQPPSAPSPFTSSAGAPANAVIDASFLSRTVDLLVSAQTSYQQKQDAWKQLRDAGKPDQAIAELEQRVAGDPRVAEYAAALGQAYLKKCGTIQDVREQGILALQADKAFDAALSLDPSNWEARFTKAVAMSYWPPTLNKGDEVIQQFQTLIGQQEAQTPQPEFAGTYAWLGDQYQKAGRSDDARSVWQRGAALFPADEKFAEPADRNAMISKPKLGREESAFEGAGRNQLSNPEQFVMLSPMDDTQRPSTSRSPEPGREEALFEAALALPPEQRAAWLERACGRDAQLRQRVELLLRANEKAGEFLRPASGAVVERTELIPTPPTEKPGDVIGPYKIREKLGEGGCGVVYVAEQTEPVRRRVAIKVIKLGMDTRNVIARFEAERQALAMMDHPNIARVLDAGATETGRPYFVMELVRGIKITEYCDQNHLDTKQRLELFVQVCHAVQHAHQKGVIHRDIKPSNILTTLHDGVPVPKVIDFGIAKATEGRLTDLTVYTELRQFIGTPAYMSPEQAEMSGLDIDTRSDIYSLGVLLYELLTDRTPFDGQELIQSGLDQMRRTIREKEPLRPSTCLSTMLDADLTAVAKRHGAESPKLIHFIRGDLDWVVMKALEKDRTRRYESASSLATDVERFLENEPIEARPPSGFYRFQKLVRRNKTAFAAAAAVAAALVLGLGLSLYLFIQERHALKRAVAAERRQAELREQAEKGLELEKHQREMAPIGEKMAAAGRFMSQGQFDKAEEVMKDVPTNFPQSSVIYNVLGEVFGRYCVWPAATRNFKRSVVADPTNHYAYHYLAPLLVQTGDLEGYRKLCERTLDKFGRTTDPAIAERIAKDCLILSPPAADLEKIANLADTALDAGPGDSSWPYYAFAKGLAEYRQGHFAGALEWLGKVPAAEDVPARTAQLYAVRTMAEFQSGQTNAARASLAEGVRIAETKLTQPGRIDWNDQLIAQFLLKEAKALIPDAPASAGK